MALVAYFNLELHQMDVKVGFLNGDLEEEMYMKQFEGFFSSENENLVFRINKSIYGLKQASCEWYLRFHDVISHLVLSRILRINAYTIKIMGVSFAF